VPKPVTKPPRRYTKRAVDTRDPESVLQCQNVNGLCNNGQQSVRRIAHKTGLSKSSVPRLQQARARRDTHPESWWWETADGRCWRIRLVVATLSTFGLTRGVGAETLSAFFGRLRLETHVGCSPSALRGVMQALEHVLLETAAAWEHEGIAAGEMRPLIGAVDETFLERMMLVFMDLVSGSLLFEEVAEDRTSTTWYALVEARLEALGVGVVSLVSDRAKALIKLAETGLDCLRIPDVFHRIQDLVKSYALAMCGPLRQARQAFNQARQALTMCQASHRSSDEAQQAQAEVARWERVHSAYRHHLETVSLIVHPWRLCTSTPQMSQDVERRLHAAIDAITAFIATQGLPATKKAVEKVRKQLAGVSALVDVWWQRVWHDAQQVALTPMWKSWIAEQLVPLLYGQHHVSRTRCPRRKAKLSQALESVQDTFDTHLITAQLAPEVLAGWKAWAAEHA
jgi:hypothetical protein